MFKTTLSAIAFFVFSLSAQAQLLWKITGNGMKKPAYLYGTMHVADARAFVLKDKLIEKIGECDAYAGEMIFDPSMMFAILPQLFMEKDTTLKTLLDEKEYNIVKQAIEEKLGMMSSFADRMKPIFTSMLLQEGGMEKMQNAPPNEKENKPLDLFLQEEASKKKLELIGLETLEEQMNVFNYIPLKKQAKMLYKEIIDAEIEKGTSDHTTDLDQMLKWYSEQKLDSLYQYSTQEFANDPELGYQIMTKRNLNMAERTVKLLATKSVFIAIGAAHLPGKEGVIELLRKKKFKVEPLK